MTTIKSTHTYWYMYCTNVRGGGEKWSFAIISKTTCKRTINSSKAYPILKIYSDGQRTKNIMALHF